MPVYFISAHSPTREITQNSFSQINLDDTKSRTYFCQSKWLTLNAILDRPNLQQKNWRKTNGESLPKNKKSILSCGKLKARGQNLRAEFKMGHLFKKAAVRWRTHLGKSGLLSILLNLRFFYIYAKCCFWSSPNDCIDVICYRKSYDKTCLELLVAIV